MRGMADRHATFIAGHVRALDDGVAFGFGQVATITFANPSYSTTGIVTEAPVTQSVYVDGPLEENNQYQGAEFAPIASREVVFYLPAELIDAEPSNGDRITLADGTVYSIVGVERLQVRGDAHVFRLRCGQVVV